MAIHLLDVNVLVALAWRTHEHHQVAADWFANAADDGWATCPMTQCGFVRISSNPKIIHKAVSPMQAVALLQEMLKNKNHVFWEENISLTDTKYFGRFTITGHRQITDAYLLELAIRNGGRIATLDRGIPLLANSPADRESVVLIK